MADKKGTILIRFPDDLADKLRRASFELNIPIKDIVSKIIEENLEVWFGDRALEAFGKSEEVFAKLERVIGRTTDIAFVEKMGNKLRQIRESQKYLKKAARLISHGVLPLEMLFSEEDHPASSGPHPSSRSTSSHEVPEPRSKPSNGRNKKKAP